MLSRFDRISGSFFGTALGDALGRPTEFQSFSTVGPLFPKLTLPEAALVTDDTQMALALGWALWDWRAVSTLPSDRCSCGTCRSGRDGSILLLNYIMRDAFVEWYHDPRNNRAPGATCMGSIAAMERRRQRLKLYDWVKTTALDSKGCGANMRVQPVAYLGLSEEDQAGLAQFQSALTHAHPTALAASDATAHAISYLLQGGAPDGLLDDLEEYARRQQRVYHQVWLGPLADRVCQQPADFIQRGWNEVLNSLADIRPGLAAMDQDPMLDPCSFTGGGWIAEEALSAAVLCFLLYPEDPVKVIQRGACTSGDSDSIACIAGALAGAYKGLEGWPSDWVDRIEYHADLMMQSRYFSSIQP